MFTSETAWAGFDDKKRGTLEPGKSADMAVLNKNPLILKKSADRSENPGPVYGGHPL